MKRRKMILCLSIILFGAVVTGQLVASANGIGAEENQATETEQDITTEQAVKDGQTSETITGIAGDDTGEKVEEKTENGNSGESDKEEGEEKIEKSTDNKGVNSNESSKDAVMDNLEDGLEEREVEEEQSVSDSLYYQGLRYYINQYQYECEIVYLQSYLEYAKLEVSACKEMYNMGQMTAADVKSYQAQQASIEAQIKVAKNQSSYNNLFLKENNLDYSEYVMKETKNVENIDYYIERYSAKNHMTMADYVTSYYNAWAYIEAKKVEMESLTMKLDSAKLLYETGELSKLELKQQEVALAKVQYELEQYYVEMNQAYINLITYCR